MLLLKCRFTSTETVGLLGTGLLHSSCALIPQKPQYGLYQGREGKGGGGGGGKWETGYLQNPLIPSALCEPVWSSGKEFEAGKQKGLGSIPLRLSGFKFGTFTGHFPSGTLASMVVKGLKAKVVGTSDCPRHVSPTSEDTKADITMGRRQSVSAESS